MFCFSRSVIWLKRFPSFPNSSLDSRETLTSSEPLLICSTPEASFLIGDVIPRDNQNPKTQATIITRYQGLVFKREIAASFSSEFDATVVVNTSDTALSRIFSIAVGIG